MKRYVGRGYTVYAHTNKTNYKTYFGQTSCEDLTRRWAGGGGYKGCPVFYNAIKKYGWDGFTHEIIKTGLTKDEADALEKECIWFFRTDEREFGYNVQGGGHHSGKLTEDGRMSLSEKSSGKNSPVARPVCAFDCGGNFIREFHTITEAAKFFNISVGRLSTHCKSMSGTCSGKIFVYKDIIGSAEHLPPERCIQPYAVKRSSREISQYTLDGRFIRKFNSVKDAAKSVGVGKSTIIGVLRRNDSKGSCAGYQWRYYDGSTNPIPPHQQKGGACRIDVSNMNVCQIDVKTGRICHVFKDIASASVSSGICSEEIQNSLEGLSDNANGYAWEYAGEYSRRTGLRTRAVNKRRSIASVDPSTNKIVEKFSSVSEASQKTGIRSSYLFSGLSGRYRTVHGLKWIYLSD